MVFSNKTNMQSI